MHRYPEGTVATPDDLRTSRWKATVAAADKDAYSAIWGELSKAASRAMDEGRAAEAKALWLLADACSMMLKPSNLNEPFAPMAVFPDRRSAIPGDFSADDIALFAAVAPDIDNDLIRARLGDLVWLCGKPRDVSCAILAIDAYRAVPLTADTWVHDARDCWQRAIALCFQLRDGAGARLEEMESALVAMFDGAVNSDGFGLSIARLLFENNLARKHARQNGDVLAARGLSLAQAGHDGDARGYLDAAAQWYARAGAKELQADITCAVAETWASEAAARAKGQHASNMVAASFYENAIQAFRRVPRALRAGRRVDERIAELHRLLDGAGKAALDEMGLISSGPMDISALVEESQASVRGKSLTDALLALANLHRGARKARLQASAEKTLRAHPLQALFASTHMSRDGRVVAKRPAMGFGGGTDSDEYRQVLWAEMVKHYQMEIGLVAQGQLLPALEVLLLEHRIREDDLLHIVSNSPIVPHGRAELIAKGLFSGFERDLVVALHLLTPQVEHLVRWHLKAASVKTTTLSADGIENENGLSTLVDLPEVVTIFGEDLAFELKALFCDAFGPNLRNEVAHGLLDAPGCQTAHSFYAWWLVLRLTFNTFWNAARKAGQHPPAADEPDIDEPDVDPESPSPSEPK